MPPLVRKKVGPSPIAADSAISSICLAAGLAAGGRVASRAAWAPARWPSRVSAPGWLDTTQESPVRMKVATVHSRRPSCRVTPTDWGSLSVPIEPAHDSTRDNADCPDDLPAPVGRTPPRNGPAAGWVPAGAPCVLKVSMWPARSPCSASIKPQAAADERPKPSTDPGAARGAAPAACNPGIKPDEEEVEVVCGLVVGGPLPPRQLPCRQLVEDALTNGMARPKCCRGSLVLRSSR